MFTITDPSLIINSLLDTDYYKLTMMQAVFHQFPYTIVEYEFKCRTPGVDLSTYAEQIKEEIDHLGELIFKTDEINYLSSQGIFQNDFLSYLKTFKLVPWFVKIKTDPFELRIKGLWLHTILFETPILAIISEIYCKKKLKIDQLLSPDKPGSYGNSMLKHNYWRTLKLKDGNIKFADFGTRRRYSKEWQSKVIKWFFENSPNNFVGTSNVHFAKEYNLKSIGTMAHEWLQSGQSLTPNGLETSQKYTLIKWLDEYNGKLGIALTDVINMDCFLKDFVLSFAEAYQGCRQDSGDPFIWGNQLIAHYQNLDIDPMTKTAVFSDGLTFDKMILINDCFKDRINCMFGIGTNLTNDVGIEPLQIVIKMVSCDGKPVAKISDSPGKGMCRDKNYLKKLKKAYNLEEG